MILGVHRSGIVGGEGDTVLMGGVDVVEGLHGT